MSRRRSVVGENPLSAIDQMVGGEPAEAPPKPTRPRRSAGRSRSRPAKRARPTSSPAPTPSTQSGRPGSDGPAKVRATFHIPAELLDECRDAVVALSGPPERLTLAALAEEALRRQLERLKRQHNDGADFESRGAELRGGRPIGS